MYEFIQFVFEEAVCHLRFHVGELFSRVLSPFAFQRAEIPLVQAAVQGVELRAHDAFKFLCEFCTVGWRHKCLLDASALPAGRQVRNNSFLPGLYFFDLFTCSSKGFFNGWFVYFSGVHLYHIDEAVFAGNGEIHLGFRWKLFITLRIRRIDDKFTTFFFEPDTNR